MDAARAGAAMIGDKRRIGFEREVKQNFGEEKIRTLFGIDEECIFADPAETGALREITFKDRTGICVVAVLYWTPDLRLDELNEFFHPSWEDVVIVRALGVGCDMYLKFRRFDCTRLSARSAQREGRKWGRVRCSQHQNGFTFRQNLERVGAARAGAFVGEIVHVAVLILREPIFKCGIMRRRFRKRHASQDKSQLACFVFDRLF